MRIASFDQGLGKELRKALLEIKRSNLEGLILDLRNNPGGLRMKRLRWRVSSWKAETWSW